MRKRCSSRSGQAMVEYAVLIGIVTFALLAMQVYAKRSIQAGIKTAADRLSPFGAADPDGRKAQVLGASYESGERRHQSIAVAGKLLDRQSAVATQSDRTVNESLPSAGGSLTRTLPTPDSTTTTGALGGGVSLRSSVIIEVE